MDYKKTRADLEIALVSTGVDVGPAIYLARTFGTDIDTVVKFFIFILIFVFDPLAVMLVIAYNQALILRSEEDESSQRHAEFIEDEERMDIIGQNGNDGLHYEEVDIPNEPLEENDPTPVDSTPTMRGGIKIQ